MFHSALHTNYQRSCWSWSIQCDIQRLFVNPFVKKLHKKIYQQGFYNLSKTKKERSWEIYYRKCPWECYTQSWWACNAFFTIALMFQFRIMSWNSHHVTHINANKQVGDFIPYFPSVLYIKVTKICVFCSKNVCTWLNPHGICAKSLSL